MCVLPTVAASLAAAPGFSSCLPRVSAAASHGLSSCASHPLEHRLDSCGSGASMLHGWRTRDQTCVSCIGKRIPLGCHGSSLFFSLLPGSLVVNSKMVPGTMWAIALLCAEDLAVLKPLLLLHHQFMCQHSEKGNHCISTFMKIILMFLKYSYDIHVCNTGCGNITLETTALN